MLLALAPAAASAQGGLRTLHVEALAMRADRSTLRVGEVFHLAIHVRVRERVAALDELVVPDVGTMQLLGDERSTTRAAAGTDIVETLTLEPTASGRVTFAPAYLDAIDARTHRPSRFSSNPVTVIVGAPAATAIATTHMAIAFATALLALLALVAALGILIALGRLRARRERASVTIAPPLAPPQPAAAVPPRDRVAAALHAFRTAPSPVTLLALRGELFRAAGASAGATLRDALRANGDGGLRAALMAAERAAFGPAEARADAAVELADATETWLR